MKKTLRDLVSVLAALMVLAVLSGCGGGIEDTNGETDFTLQTITDADIIEGMNTMSFMSSQSSVTVNGVSKNKISVGTMSGVMELYEGRLNNESLTVVLSGSVTKGNARIVVVLENEIVHDFELNAADQSFTLENASGRVYIKIAGESAGFSVEYTAEK